MKRNSGMTPTRYSIFVLLLLLLTVILRVDSSLHKATHSLIEKRLQIAVLTPPEMGHYNSQSGVIEELVRRGHNVTLFLSKPCHSWVLLKNITLVDAGDAMPQDIVDKVSHVNIVKVMLAGLDILFRMDSGVEDAIIRELEHNPPDLIISDLILKSGVKFSLRKKIPLVFTCPFLYPNPWVHPFWNPMITSGLPLSDRWHHRVFNYVAIQLHRWVVGIFMSLSVNFYEYSLLGAWEYPTIVSMNWGVDHAFSLPPYVFYVGSTRNFEEYPPLTPKLAEWLDRDVSQTIVFVSMGTVSHQTPEELEIMFNGLFMTPGRRILWTLRADHHHYVLGFCKKLNNCSEDNFRLEPYVPQLAVLAHPGVKLFVTHGGANSVLESIHFAKPVVCLPLFGDQLDMCQRASDKGFGYQINPKTMKPQDLDYGMNKVLHEPSYLKTIQTLSLINRAAGGASRAVDIIESLSITGHEYLLPFDTKLSWYQRWDLDILITLFAAFSVLCLIVYGCFSCLCGRKGSPTKGSVKSSTSKKSQPKNSKHLKQT